VKEKQDTRQELMDFIKGVKIWMDQRPEATAADRECLDSVISIIRQVTNRLDVFNRTNPELGDRVVDILEKRQKQLIAFLTTLGSDGESDGALGAFSYDDVKDMLDEIKAVVSASPVVVPSIVVLSPGEVASMFGTIRYTDAPLKDFQDWLAYRCGLKIQQG
jgi:hypothetical protein